jgi:hypothetical protein
MKYTLTALLILVGIILVAIALYRSPGPKADEAVRDSDNEAGGFRDWVKNPDLKNEASRAFAEREEARKSLHVPADISDAEIQKMVERVFVQEDKDFNYARLEIVGKKAKPFLLEALADPRVATRFDPDGFTNGPNYPLQRICGLLADVQFAFASRVLALRLLAARVPEAFGVLPASQALLFGTAQPLAGRALLASILQRDLVGVLSCEPRLN